jgi:hypothetical protein
MSEQFSPFGTPPSGGVGLAEPPAVEEGSVEPGSRNKLYLLIGGAVAVVVGIAVYFLLFSGGSSDTTATGPVVATPPQARASASGSPSAAASTAAVPPTQTISQVRDPFKPVVVAPAAAASTAPSAAASTAPAAPTTGLPAAPATGGPATFSVVSVDSKAGTAVTMVDGVKFTASVGQTFATYFKLVAVNVSTPCGVFQYGDSSMNLCAKDTVSLS